MEIFATGLTISTIAPVVIAVRIVNMDNIATTLASDITILVTQLTDSIPVDNGDRIVIVNGIATIVATSSQIIGTIAA